jgi:pantoate--beta-alanine ligase
MKIIRSIKLLRKEIASFRKKGKTVGFVPTMGYFHDGHLSLMRQSVKENDVSVVSLFVNPIQFGPKEDLSVYPRDMKRDASLAKRVGVDILFVPPVAEMYPVELFTHINVDVLSEGLCGASRPGHFSGVVTVVAKLINIVLPDVIYLGQKDAQQVVVIKKMIRDLDFALRVKVCPIFREPDGLAMSSRNIFLSPTEREEASALSRALKSARKCILQGESDASKIISQIKKLILDETSASILYVACVSVEDLKVVRRIEGAVMLLLAVNFASVRLIDNEIVTIKKRF